MFEGTNFECLDFVTCNWTLKYHPEEDSKRMGCLTKGKYLNGSQRATSHLLRPVFSIFIACSCRAPYYLKGPNMQICGTCSKEQLPTAVSECMSTLWSQVCAHVHLSLKCCGGCHEIHKLETCLCVKVCSRHLVCFLFLI